MQTKIVFFSLRLRSNFIIILSFANHHNYFLTIILVFMQFFSTPKFASLRKEVKMARMTEVNTQYYISKHTHPFTASAITASAFYHNKKCESNSVRTYCIYKEKKAKKSLTKTKIVCVCVPSTSRPDKK